MKIIDKLSLFYFNQLVVQSYRNSMDCIRWTWFAMAADNKKLEIEWKVSNETDQPATNAMKNIMTNVVTNAITDAITNIVTNAITNAMTIAVTNVTANAMTIAFTNAIKNAIIIIIL